jgi:hypothetical protein
MPNLDFTTQLKNDFKTIIQAKLTELGTFDPNIVKLAGERVTAETFPVIYVDAFNIGDAFKASNKNHGIQEADILIQPQTYYADDPQGSQLSTLVNEVNQLLWDADLLNILNLASLYTYFSAINTTTYPDPDDAVKKANLPIQVNFSATK